MLRRKLLIRFGLLVGAFVCGAFVAVWFLQNALADIDRTNADAATLLGGIQSVGGAVTSIELARDRLGPSLTPADTADAVRTIEQTMQTLSAHHVVSAPKAPASADFQKLQALLPAFLANRDPSPTPANSLSRSVELRTAVERLSEALRAHVAAEQTNLGKHFRTLVLGLTLAALLMVNIAIFVLLRTAQVVLKPVAALVEGSRRLAAEHFDHRVAIDQSDEFGELALAYNHLAEQLQANEERKAETVRQLAVTLNHDLNNAMAVIELQLGLLARRSGPNATLGQPLVEIRANLAQMSDTVASLKNIRRVVLMDYIPGQKMLDLPRSVAPPENSP